MVCAQLPLSGRIHELQCILPPSCWVTLSSLWGQGVGIVVGPEEQDQRRAGCVGAQACGRHHVLLSCWVLCPVTTMYHFFL